MYRDGEGTPRDDQEAIKWYRAAAEQSDVDAQFSLLHDRGRGTPRDYEQAIRWYRAAAEQGDADAQVITWLA